MFFVFVLGDLLCSAWSTIIILFFVYSSPFLSPLVSGMFGEQKWIRVLRDEGFVATFLLLG